MIPYFRIKFEKHYSKYPNRKLNSMAFYIDSAVIGVMKRIGRPITSFEYMGLCKRYADMISGNPASTMSSISNYVEASGSGRFILHDGIEADIVREISAYRGNELNYESTKEKFSYVADKEKISRAVELNQDRIASELWHKYYYHPQRSKFISWFINCECCGKVEKKSTVVCDDICRSCSCRMTHYNRVKKETVEVNRLINKLKKVVKNESKRLTQEIS